MLSSLGVGGNLASFAVLGLGTRPARGNHEGILRSVLIQAMNFECEIMFNVKVVTQV